METSRRGFLAALSAAMPNSADAQDKPQDHQHQLVPSDISLRVKSLESLLVEKGLVDPAALDALVDTYENKVGPRNGAKVVARAWTDPAYKKRLLSDAAAGDCGTGILEHAGRTHARGGEHARKCTMSWCARCVPVIRGRFWVCRRSGTSPRRTVPGRSSIRAASSRSSDSSCPRTWRCGSGIARPSCDISFFRSGPRERST